MINKVDNIEGRMSEGMDEFEGLIRNEWDVKVKGEKKMWEMRFIEEKERRKREWYGGEIGMMNLNGDMNKGMKMRKIRIKDGVEEISEGEKIMLD